MKPSQCERDAVEQKQEQRSRPGSLTAAEHAWQGRWTNILPAVDAQATSTLPTPKEWLSFFLQIVFVVMIEVSDDLLRGVVFPRPVGPALANALRVMRFEQAHGIWQEPAVQRFFEQSHHVLGLALSWPQVVPLANSLYGVAHGLVTALVAVWLYWRRPQVFPFVRNVFAFATALSVALYNIFPVAPPRLAIGLVYEGRPYHFVDTVFVGGGVNLSFDKYAAMPSLHMVWALIAGATLLIEGRHLLLRVIGVAHPMLIGAAVIVTGNHYFLDCIGGAVVVVVAYMLASLVSLWPAAASFGGRTLPRGRTSLRNG